MKKKNQKGFTLVEVIVVLVILAILATIMIPSLTGYIDKAGDRAVIAECRSAVLAAQTVASEQYALHGTFSAAEAQTLAEVPGVIGTVEFASGTSQVSHLTYTNDNKTVLYCRTPESCATHDEMFTVTATAADSGTGGGLPVLSVSDRVVDVGSSLVDAYSALPAGKKYSRIDSSALTTPDSAAQMLYNSLSDEQKALLDGYVWCYYIETNGPRLYLAEKADIEDGGGFTTYKCNPNPTNPDERYQSNTLTTLDANGKFALNRNWSDWRAEM